MLSKDTVSHKKRFLSSLLKAPLAQMAGQAATCWDNPEELTQTLKAGMCKLPHCQLLYAIDTAGRQLSPNITRNGIDNTWRGQDLSTRPYLQGILPFQGLTLSAAYLSQRSMQPCITAIQAVRQDDRLPGFVAADFHLKDLPNMSGTSLQCMQQMRDYPTQSDRHGGQLRRRSLLDQNIDYLIYVLSTLMQEHGVFHCTLHFTSARAVLWSVDDPMNYRVHSVGELLNPELFSRYPKRGYDHPIRLEIDKIPLVFAQLKALRQSDDTVYLRSGSVNIVNGHMGLTFSCDGSHYISAEDFLNHELTYWLEHDHLREHSVNTSTPN